MSELRSLLSEAIRDLAITVPQDDKHLVLPGDPDLVANHLATAIEASGLLTADNLDPNLMQVDAVITKPSVTANVKANFSISDALRAVFSDPGKPQQ